MKKVKRFQEGGYEDSDDAKNLMKAQAREDANAAEPGTETTAAFMKRTGTKANPPMSRTFTSKGPIVTKEQMKKAGFDNLRDYLNAEQGLKRRDDKAAKGKSLPGKAAEGQVSDIVGAKKGGMIGSASKRADGCAQRGKTKGRMV